ncbi:MAG: glycosyltransferase [candidate division Zixibacteria bacterium]|nr:glycosyltransferase [candidate division Zixibacteria bacterium]
MEKDEKQKFGRKKRKTAFIPPGIGSVTGEDRRSEDEEEQKNEQKNDNRQDNDNSANRSETKQAVISPEDSVKNHPVETKDDASRANSNNSAFEKTKEQPRRNGNSGRSNVPDRKSIQGNPSKTKPDRQAKAGKIKRRPLGDEPPKKNRPEKTSMRRNMPDKRTSRRRKQPRVSVIIPAYNEEQNIPILLDHLRDMLDGVNYDGEVIVVDDGSDDNTHQILREGVRNYSFLRYIRHRRNRGLTAALETGFSSANGEILVFYPADLQYLPNDIPRMVDKIDDGADFVCGWRQGKYGFMKSVVSFFYNRLSRLLFGVRVHDLNSVKAFKREVLESFTYREGWHRFLPVMAANDGYEVDEVKVKLYPREHGKSKFGFWSFLGGLFDLITVKFQLTFLKKPMLLFGSVGLLFALIGIIVGIVAVYLRFMEHEGYRALLFLIVLLILSGLSLFALGFLAEVLAAMIEDIRTIKRENNS